MADAVLRRLVQHVDAGASCYTGCQHRYTFCKDGRLYYSYWTKNYWCDWNYWCYSVRTSYPCY
jgi:hypothetical protein